MAARLKIVIERGCLLLVLAAAFMWVVSAPQKLARLAPPAHHVTAHHASNFNAIPVDSRDMSCVAASSFAPFLTSVHGRPHVVPLLITAPEDRAVFYIRPPPFAV